MLKPTQNVTPAGTTISCSRSLASVWYFAAVSGVSDWRP